MTTFDLTPVYPQPPTAQQAAWLADPPPGDWLALLAADRVPAFMWDGLDRQWLGPEPRLQAAALGTHWFPRPTLEALALTYSCWQCYADPGEPCSGRRTHKRRLGRAIRPWNRAAAGAPFAEHRDPGRCYVVLGGRPVTAPRRIHWNRFARRPLPDGAKVVGRSSRWGNPFVVGIDAVDRADAVARYAEWLSTDDPRAVRIMAEIGELTGFDLACEGCPVDGGPCHADVLLDLANPVVAPVTS